MDEWTGLRTAALIAVWLTVAGGALMATIWFASGGNRAVGPDDEVMGDGSPRVRRADDTPRRITSFTPAQVGMHGLLGLLTACLISYGLARDAGRTDGYIPILLAIAVTAIPGVLMFRKWHAGDRPVVPAVRSTATATTQERVEDRLPRPVVYLHGLAAFATAALVAVLLFVD